MKCGMIGNFKIGFKKVRLLVIVMNKEHNKVDEVFFIDTINGDKNGHWEKILCINKKNVSFKFDSGADLNVLPFDILST